MSNDHYGHGGGAGTDIESFQSVMQTVRRLVRQKWSGWSSTDQDDLESIVLEKYFAHFGRVRLPEDSSGKLAVPVPWLRKVVTNAGIDFHRRAEARPRAVADLFDQDNPEVERTLLDALAGAPGLSTVVATEQAIRSSFRALRDAYPDDARLIWWSLIEDRPLSEITQLAGKPSEEATKKALQRAKKKLRGLVEVALEVKD